MRIRLGAARRRHPLTPFVLLVGIAATTLAVSAGTPATPANAAMGGRVMLSQPGRSTDTRFGPKVTQIGLPNLATVWITQPTADGSGTIHPCGSAPGPVPTVLFEADETVYTKVANSDPMCLSLSTPAHVVIDVLGSITATPFDGGLQYVPDAAQPVVFDADIDRQAGEPISTTRLDLGLVPADARAAVLLLEARNPSRPGYVLTSGCPASLSADMGFMNDRAVGLSYVDLPDTGGEICLQYLGATPLRITLLGWLSINGPDPTRLPPTLSAPDQPIRLPGLRAFTPQRILDTRSGLGASKAAKLVGGTTFELPIAQAASSTTAVALNVTVTEPDAQGFLTVFPCDQNRPKASNLNFVGNETVPNLVNVKLSVTSSVCIYSQATTHLIVDLSGTFETDGGSGATTVSPVRVLDTRIPIGVSTAAKVTGGSEVALQVTNPAGVPSSGVSAVTMNVTVTEPEQDGFVTVYPCGSVRPTASNLNFVAGQTVPNLVTVRVSAAGTVCLFTQRTTHLVADLAAWYGLDQPNGYRELEPDRLLDTREPIGVDSIGPLIGGQTLVVQVAGRGGVPPTGATAVTMNVTAVEPVADGFVTVYPCDAPERPTASNLNHTRGEVVPNLTTVQLASNGTVCFFAQRTTHLVADVAGYFSSVPEVVASPAVVGAG
jgi:hypothetical protein